jgi:DNA invertase Pin-like site-specific DNA recombinase
MTAKHSAIYVRVSSKQQDHASQMPDLERWVAGRLHARILASVAEYETEVRAERVAAGQAVARKKGKKWGGSKKGWRWKVTDDQLAAIHEMRAAGKPVAQIARVTGLSRPTIYRILEEHQPKQE